MWRLTTVAARHRFLSLWRSAIRQQPERGAVAVMVALLMIPVLIGTLAIAVDAGSVYVGRRQAQNGADAAAFALAGACATSTSGCTATAAGDLDTMTRDNADARMDSTVSDACIQTATASGTTIVGSGCAGATVADLHECPYPLPSGVNGVQIRARTHFNLILAPALRIFADSPEDSADDRAAVEACASAAWGPVNSFEVVAPLAFSLCDFQGMMESSGFAAAPPYQSPVPTSVSSHETAIVVNDPGQPIDSNNCARWAGHVLPGGFGYLHPETGCRFEVTNGQWIQGKPGNSVPNSCKGVMDAALGTVLLIPVFDCVSDSSLRCPTATNGSDTWYHIAGLAAFYVTGANMPSYSKAPVSSTTVCPSGQKCLYGWFTKATLSPLEGSWGGLGTKDYGVEVVQMVG